MRNAAWTPSGVIVMSISRNGVHADPTSSARTAPGLDEHLEPLQILVRELADDLVFALSLGSKELFHTNLLGWLAEKHRGVGDALLRLWNGPEAPLGPVRARREWQHLDLVLDEVASGIEGGPARVVVENKMFALPDLEQLRKYGKAVRKLINGSPSLILLSLADPGWPDHSWDDGNGSVWRHCSYRALADALEPVSHAPDIDPFVNDTLIRWRAMLDRLHRLIDLVGRPDTDEPFQLPREMRQALGSIRLSSPVQKLRAHNLASALRRELHDVDDVLISAGLTNSIGFVEAFVPVADGVEAGWQLQGAEWRMAIRVGPKHKLYGRDAEQIAARALLAERSGWPTFDQSPFDSPPFAGLSSGPMSVHGRPAYGRFSPDFVYRYLRPETITARQVVTAGAEVIRRAATARHGTTTFQLL